MTERRAWILLALAAALLLTGGFLVRGNHYAHLHRQIHKAYAQYMQDWDRDVRADFVATSWELHVQGREQPLPLQPRALPAKRLAHTHTAADGTDGSVGDDGSDGFETRSGARAAGGQDGAGALASGGSSEDHEGEQEPVRGLPGVQEAQEQQQQRQQRGRQRRRAAAAGVVSGSSLLEFRLEGLMEALHPAFVPPMDRHTAAHSRLWRPAGGELRRPVALTLRATNTRTGAVSVVELGEVAFVREATVEAGGQGRCVYEERGTWQPDGTCSVREYLWGLCVKVAPGGAGGALSADSSMGGGPGCGPEWRWQLGQWRRLDERRHSIHGRMYLPLSARNSTIVTVRHARDPSILESDLVRRLAPNVEEQIMLHAVGLAMCFLGLVLLLSVAAFAAPALARRARATWGVLRGRRSKRARSGRGDGGLAAMDGFVGDGGIEKDSDGEAD